ncbi:hypothetical protein SDRG_00078 [Saprolegnia diclina VS20]|uniref:Uncharacterized protein n=1 Tax=Saprolegnia diclina (strain VS20) TaxID=1156394 RepID=T0QVT1_SAPDV|nr:hypothetical protein SDRG_00078 [Saprolegnia diclina VS20]EQC42339.1 hypothetical protein SDRG_00078 [Saprolegnia diclina VS20]|eukprot:XP_008603762.1 hypothetical protein SDRG_00078 [Saprolegnia diclina VS20]
MGGGASTIAGFEALSPADQANAQAQYQALVADGTSDETAMTAIRAKFTAATVLIELPQLLDAIAAAVSRGKTPLVVDASDRVNTFFSYRQCTLLDGKKMAMDKSMRKVPVPEIMEEARARLVGALKCGHPMVIAMNQCVVDVWKTFNDATLPVDVTQHGRLAFFPSDLVCSNAGKGLLNHLDSLYRPADTKDTSNIPLCRNPNEFHVVLTSNFAHVDFEKYLFKPEMGLPPPKYQYEFILVQQEAIEEDL